MTMLPTSMVYTDPAAAAQTIEPSRWILDHALDLTVLVPLLNGENLCIISL